MAVSDSGASATEDTCVTVHNLTASVKKIKNAFALGTRLKAFC